MKKYIYTSLALAILFIIIIPNGVVEAQRYRDPVSPFDGQDEQYISNWRRESSAMNTSISQLSPNPVLEIPIPVLFGVRLSDIYPNYGDPRSGGRTHEGEDIIAKNGDPIISPTDAVVLRVGTGTNSGYYVYTANPGGETFVYMHLETMSTLVSGNVLKTGDLIGYVGNTGNASGGGAHLHFEIRKDGSSTDPYPRIKRELTPAEKMQFTNQILEKSSNATALADVLVQNYFQEFINARTLGVTLPTGIADAMSRVNVTPAPILGSSDLYLGMRSNDVIALQNFLIMQDKGIGARALSSAGATGYFGNITRTALLEYQTSVGLIPASGVYDSVTRAFIQNGTLPTPPSNPVPLITPPQTNPNGVPLFDLTINSRGVDVIWLQTFLIEKHVGLASTALASAGATGYFGNITRLALAEYQASVGITPAVGYFGSITRAYIYSN